jgi:selenocysteine lyase/cysteine desulfurase
MAELGKQRLADFYVDPSYINVNHGSYGYVPRVVMEEKRKLMERCEFNTEKWFRWDVEGLVEEARTYIAYRINCSPQNVFLVQNATDGINSILKSFNWKEDDTVLIPNTAYACVRKTVVSLKDRYNINILDVFIVLFS